MADKQRKIPGYKSIEDAAQAAGVSRPTLYRWISKLGITPAENAAYLSDDDIKRIKEEREKYGD